MRTTPSEAQVLPMIQTVFQDGSRRSREFRGALADGCGIFGVGDVLHPGHMIAIERLLHGDMDHAGGRRGAMPMLLVRWNKDDVAGPDLADRAALGLNPSDALDHVERLSKGVGVPGRARPSLE